MSEIFEAAYKESMGHEGGYANDHNDKGGETYKGISRVYHPHWGGWQTVDSFKGVAEFPLCLDKSARLQGLVKDFYRKKFFAPFQGADMPKAIAMEMFDTAVNMGVGRAVEFLQRSLNLLNKNQQLYPDIAVDYGFGPKTKATLLAFLKKHPHKDPVGFLCQMLNHYQAKKYIELMEKDRTQERFWGWYARVMLSKIFEGVTK